MIAKFTLSTLFFISTFFISGFAQQDSTKPRVINPNLMDVKDIFSVTNSDRTTWSLFGQYNNIEYAPTNAEDVIIDIDNYLANPPTENKRRGQLKEFGYIKKYRNNIDSTFKGLKLLGSDQLGKFLYGKKYSLPIHFCMYGDTALSFIVSGAYIDNIYNTLKLTGRQRAAKVITTYILPSLKSYARAFSNSEIKYFGMTCIYGSKDFTDKSALALKPEFVGFIAPAKLIKKYVSGDLTEDELIEASDIYVCDRDMVAEIKKIKIVLE